MEAVTTELSATLPGHVEAKLTAYLARAELVDLVMRFHAHTDRWEWDRVADLVTDDCQISTCIDRVPVFQNWDGGNTGFTRSTNWREAAAVRGQHRWCNIIVDIDGGSAKLYMSGTQTNTFPDGEFETSGILQEATCRLTTDGWRIASMTGSYESNHARLDKVFAARRCEQERCVSAARHGRTGSPPR